jgi:hypothetical protein
MQAQLEPNVPVISAVLAPHNLHEHEPHRSFFFEHLESKGVEAAGPAPTSSRRSIDSPPPRGIAGSKLVAEASL